MTNRIARNGARIEFLACRETVATLMAQGFDKKKIHKRLTESGQFTMSYDAFCKIVTKAIRNELSLQSLASPELPPPPVAKPENKQAAPINPQRQPGIIKTGSEPFPDPRNIDPKTLI